MNLEKLIAGTTDGAFTTGPDGTIAQWNRAAAKMLGYTTREAVGRSCGDLFGGHDRNLHCPGRRSCHTTGPTNRREPGHNFDVQTRTKKGAAIWVNVTTLTVADGTTARGLTIHLLRDVTATRETMALLQERLAASTPAAESNGNGLTARELEVLRMVASGVRTKGIAERLRVSPATVRNHVQNILGKLGAHSRLEAVAHATRHRLL
jgi:PAS domain S-box-containing protein